MHVNSALMAAGASVIKSTSSDGSTASFTSSDMMLPSMASGASAPATATASMSSIIHDTHALHGKEAALTPGAASLPDAFQCLLADETVRPEILAKVVLQARLRESISCRELERERARTRALEALVQQLETELKILRNTVAREADGSSGH
jgi:hypothetical protein